MRILLIGFEPFGGDAINSSQETVKAVACDELVGVEIMKGMLPVSFKRAGTEICRLIDESVPDIVIMLGQSSKSDCIKIEHSCSIFYKDASEGTSRLFDAIRDSCKDFQ